MFTDFTQNYHKKEKEIKDGVETGITLPPISNENNLQSYTITMSWSRRQLQQKTQHKSEIKLAVQMNL